MNLSDYVALYPPQPPVERPGDHEDMFRLLGADDGVGTLPSCATGMKPAVRPGDAEASHLWVISPESIPVLLETAPDANPPLVNGKAKHTNLTGGAPACCGGEMWLDSADPKLLYVHGGSGRYGARSAQQLAQAVDLIAGYGFEVRSAGWSDEANVPERVFRDD